MVKDGKCVLLVDDDADFVDMNKTILEKNGYRVLTAYNGDECRGVLSKEHPDAIVLDIMMKTTADGMYLAHDVHRDEATKDIPIICVSSVNQVPEYNMGPDETWLPVDEFIEKPVASEVLLSEIKKKIGTS